MKLVVAGFLVIGVLVIVSDGFLFSKKFKDGCDPDPCKNKAKCVLDAKNKNISTCVCANGYHGKHCELKTGCSSNPCRKGTCIEDKKNPSNYTCKCNPGFVGPKCDTANACDKNPCKSPGSKCTLDSKLKAVCECPSGFTGKACDKRNCTIVEFKGKNFQKKPKMFVDQTILKKFQDLDALAKICGVIIAQKKSFNLQPDHKMNAPNADAPFYIGRGLEFELYDSNNKLLCNSICLGKVPIPQQPAKCLIDGLMAIGWKHSILTPGVIHDGYHLANLKDYNSLKEFKQVGCKEIKF